MLGFALFQTGKSSDAAVAYDKATKLMPKNPVYWVNLGLAYTDSKQYPEARSALTKAITLDSAITLTIGTAVFSGQVSYCVFRDYGYFVGMRFSDDSEWSAETVLPQHLTNLRCLRLCS